MTQRQRGWLIIPSSLSLLAGVFLGRTTVSLLFPLIACFFAFLSVLLMKGRYRLAACVVLSFLLGVVAGCSAFHPSLPPEGDYEIRGIVSDEVTYGSFGQYRVCLSDISLNDHPFRGGAYWTFYTDNEEFTDLLPGKQVTFCSSLYHPHGADNPDGYDFREALLQRGILIGLYGRDDLKISEPDSFSLSGWIASLRHRLSTSLIRTLGDETGSYASALLLGMRSLIPSEDRKAFSNLGIAHILTVSGFHVGILIGICAVLFRLFRLRPWIRICLYAFLLLLYAALCGMNQPVIRASLLLLIGLSGKVLNRPRSGLHMLSAVLFIMTILSPVQVTSASFQMTFCAVFGLIFIQPLSQKIMSCPIRSRLLRRFLSAMVMVFGIQLGLLFPLLVFFQRLPLLVFIISIPATFIFSVLIILLWLFALFLPFPGVASVIAAPLRFLTGSLLHGIRILGSLPGLSVWIHKPDVITGFGILFLFFGFCFYLRINKYVRTAFIITGSLAVILSLLPYNHTSTEYIQFSAGNADASLLWDQDQVYIIDAGEADGTLSSYLRSHRLTPDAVILTHLHADHAGGLHSLIDDEIPIKKLYLPFGADSLDIHPDFVALLSQLRSAGTEIIYLSRGDVIPLPSGNLTVLWPEAGKVRPNQDANHYSLVSRIALKGSVLLHAGDITGTYERYSAVPADLLKASHHGSPASTLPDYLLSVSPQAILLSCQHESRLNSFRDRCGEIPVYGTPEAGAITVRFTDRTFTVSPFLNTVY